MIMMTEEASWTGHAGFIFDQLLVKVAKLGQKVVSKDCFVSPMTQKNIKWKWQEYKYLDGMGQEGNPIS